MTSSLFYLGNAHGDPLYSGIASFGHNFADRKYRVWACWNLLLYWSDALSVLTSNEHPRIFPAERDWANPETMRLKYHSNRNLGKLTHSWNYPSISFLMNLPTGSCSLPIQRTVYYQIYASHFFHDSLPFIEIIIQKIYVEKFHDRCIKDIISTI